MATRSITRIQYRSNKIKVDELDIEAEQYLKDFEKRLISKDKSPNTTNTYIFTMKQFFLLFGSKITQKKLKDYKDYLQENFKAKTASLRISAINEFLKFIGKKDWVLENVKIQKKTFLENVISNADYEYLKKSLKDDGEIYYYFMIRFLGATGARISEFLEFKVEDVKLGYMDIYGKGNKLRRIYIPKALQKEALDYFVNQKGYESGFLWLNRFGERITKRGITGQLKVFAEKYGIKKEVLYPHSFRHRFAKNFLEKRKDIALLADLMGHESIETTRIYLKMTAGEQKAIVDQLITW
jgi:site-specific recombinase XerD